MENGVVDDMTHSVKEIVENDVTSSDMVELEADLVFEDSISADTPRVVTHSDVWNSVVPVVDSNLDSEVEVEVFKEVIEISPATDEDKMVDVEAEDKPIVEVTSPDVHIGETAANELDNSTVDDSEIEVEIFEEAIGISSATETREDEVRQVVAEDKIEDVMADTETTIVEATSPDAHPGETTANEEVGEVIIPEEHQNGAYEIEKEVIGISSATENHKDEVQFVAEGKVENVAAEDQPIDESTVTDTRQRETIANEEIGEVIMPEEHQNGTYEIEKEAIGISSAAENHKDEVQVVAEEKINSVTGDEEGHLVAEDKINSVTDDEEGQFVPEDKIEAVADDKPIVVEEATVPDAHQGETTANEGIVEVIMPEEHQNGVYEREKEAIGISSESENHKDEVQFDVEDKIKAVGADDQPIAEATASSDGEEMQNGAYERENLADLEINNKANDYVDITEKQLMIDGRPHTSGAHSLTEVDYESYQEAIHNSSPDNVNMEPNSEEKEEKVVEPMEEAEIKPAAAIPPPSQKSTAHPAGLGRAAPLSEPAPRTVHQSRVNGSLSQMQNQSVDDTLNNGEAIEEYDETREKLQMIRVKFLRLALRLGQTPHNAVVAQVLYRLGLAEQLRGRSGGRVATFSFDRASAMAEQLEAGGQEPLDFSCTIMVLGKTGVGKSATINSIFGENKFGTDAFQLGTKKVQDVVGTVQGIKVRVIDTPGLLPSWTDQPHNVKILRSVKQFMKKTPPDIVLYLDRLDMQSRDLTDLPLLRTITDIFGASIWFNAIVVLTHAASAPPEGPNGTTTSYDMFVTQRSHAVQQAIRMAAGDMRLMNPVSLVENHSACRINRSGQRVLPNGQVWKPHLLLLSFASKILTEANALLKLQDGPPGRPFTSRTRSPPLPYLLSSLLQSRPELKLPEEQFVGDDDDDDSSDSDNESEFDELPPFKPLTRVELSKLAKVQKKAYYDEIEYREKLFMKKQLKEEKKRRKIMKTMAARDLPEEEGDEGAAASVPVAMPDLALPASFDADYPSHRYRCLDSPNQWVVRPVLDTQGWDHDVGYEGVNVERLFVLKKKIPVSLSGQLTKDKKDSTLQLELASSLKHGEGKATSLGFDMQTLGKDIAYTLRGETRLSNRRRNKLATGVSATLLGDTLTAGLKLEDKLIVNKRLKMVLSGGAMTGHNDVAYGGSLEATLRDKDHPLGRFLTTLGLSVMDWHGDLAIGANLQSQIPIGRFTNLIARGNLNNRGSGNVSIRLNSSEQIQIALIAVIPLISKLVGHPQQLHYGQ